jgi:hypothetical protein
MVTEVNKVHPRNAPPGIVVYTGLGWNVTVSKLHIFANPLAHPVFVRVLGTVT